MKAQEIESQVGSQMLDAMSDRWRPFDQPSPPMSSRSTPRHSVSATSPHIDVVCVTQTVDKRT